MTFPLRAPALSGYDPAAEDPLTTAPNLPFFGSSIRRRPAMASGCGPPPDPVALHAPVAAVPVVAEPIAMLACAPPELLGGALPVPDPESAATDRPLSRAPVC